MVVWGHDVACGSLRKLPGLLAQVENRWTAMNRADQIAPYREHPRCFLVTQTSLDPASSDNNIDYLIHNHAG